MCRGNNSKWGFCLNTSKINFPTLQDPEVGIQPKRSVLILGSVAKSYHSLSGSFSLQIEVVLWLSMGNIRGWR